MATIKTLKDKDDVTVYPQTISDAVMDGQGVPLTTRLEEVSQLVQDVNGGVISFSSPITSSPQKISFAEINAGYDDIVQIELDSDKSSSFHLYLHNGSSNLVEAVITWDDNSHGSFVINNNTAVYANIYGASGQMVTLSGPYQKGVVDDIESLNDSINELDKTVNGYTKKETVVSNDESTFYSFNFADLGLTYGDTVHFSLKKSQSQQIEGYLANDDGNIVMANMTMEDGTNGTFDITRSSATKVNIRYVSANNEITVYGEYIEGVSDNVSALETEVTRISDIVLPIEFSIDWSTITVGSSARKLYTYNFIPGIIYKINIDPILSNTIFFVLRSNNEIVSTVYQYVAGGVKFVANEEADTLDIFCNVLYEAAEYQVTLFDNNSLEYLRGDVEKTIFGTSIAASKSEYDEIINQLDETTVPSVSIELSQATPHIIGISSQSDYENIGDAISEAISGGYKNIRVEVSSGVYCYSSDDLSSPEPLISLTNINDTDIDIEIFGKGDVEFVGSNKIYRRDDGELVGGGYYRLPLISTSGGGNNLSFNPTKNYYDNDGHIHTLVKDAEYMDGPITVVDAENRQFKFPLRHDDMTSEECADMWVITSHGWILNRWKVDRIEDNELFFSGTEQCDDVINNYLALDTSNSGRYPRYKLINEPGNGKIYVRNGYIYIPSSISTLYECDNICWAKIDNCSINHFEINNVTFIGCALQYNETYYYGAPRAACYVLYSRESSFMNFLEICNCHFIGVGRSLFFSSSQKAFIHDNVYKDCSPNCVHTYSIDNGTLCQNVHIARNKFVNCNAIHRETFTLEILSSDSFIYENEFVNCLSYSVLTGTGYKKVAPNDCGGIIEKNLFLNNSDGITQQHNNIQDGGQVYVNTRTTGLIIRDNVFLTPIGEYSINGIYLDWGSQNVKIYRNLIAGVSSGSDVSARAIDSSYPIEVAPYVPDYSSHNLLIYNVMTGTYRFEGISAIDGDNYKGINAILRINNDYSNTQLGNQFVEDDVLYKYVACGIDSIDLPYSLFRAFDNFGLSAFVLKHIKYVK